MHAVGAQFAPDPDFPTVAFPNPEEPGATDALLALAADIEADVAIALDPDADRCAVGIPTGKPGSGWRLLSGDETGWLLGDYLLSRTDNPETAVVASTVVSSRMLAAIATEQGVWTLQSNRAGRFEGKHRLTSANQSPQSLSATWLGGESSLVAWTAATGRRRGARRSTAG